MEAVTNGARKALFIINKYAGTGYQPQLEGRIISACGNNDVECTIEFTQHRGHATELARQASAAGFQQVIAVGGDGTINEVAQGLLHGTVPMGIIPRGSGNGLARHLGIPVHTPRAIDSLFQSSPLAMDTFTVNGKLSLNVSGIGFDGHIANLFSGQTKRGLAGYTKLTLKEFFTFPEFDFTVHINGQVLERKAFIIAIANSSQYGNNARIAPPASVCDGLLHFNILKKVPPYRLDFIYAFFSGTVEQSSFCELLEAREITINTSKPIAFHIDGEPSGHNSQFNIALHPGTLPVLVPNTSHTDRRL